MYIDLEHKFARVNLKLHGFDKCNQTKITGARMMLYTEDKYSSVFTVFSNIKSTTGNLKFKSGKNVQMYNVHVCTLPEKMSSGFSKLSPKVQM